MEYVEGRSLRDLIRTEGPLDANQAADIAVEIASALAFAHRNGVVHRDVKPGNVLLTRSGNVKVTDFGIARAGASDGLTQTGSVMGTATYFSPEQAQGLPVDGRSDVYSLGVVLYEMATGSAPFTGDSPVAVAYKHVREDAVPPSQRNAEVPRDLEQIIQTALAKDPEARYQTADDMRADLLRFRRGRPLASAPITAMVAEVPTAATTAPATGAYAAAATMASPRIDDRGRQVAAPTYERKRRNAALVTFLVLLGLALIVGGILFAATQLGNNEAKVTVPNVVDKKLSTAQKLLDDAHLRSKVKHASSTKPADTVITQDPKADTRFARNGIVTLTVSSGAPQVAVPSDLQGKTVDEATAILAGAGFKVKQQDQASNDVGKGRVVDTQPKAGEQADKGSVVTLLVSTGGEPVEIPDVSRLSPDDAGRALGISGLRRDLDHAGPRAERGRTGRRSDAHGSARARQGRTRHADPALRVERAQDRRGAACHRNDRERGQIHAHRQGLLDDVDQRDRSEQRRQGGRDRSEAGCPGAARNDDHAQHRRESHQRELDDDRRALSAQLADWYRAHGRHDLPWRATRDRWCVLVSEVMLHQTQVPRVVPAYASFIAQFPTSYAAATAGPAAVISAWGRLGYPRRARRLWESAAQIASRGWPDDLATLPGIGRYTAAAIAAQVDDADTIGIEVNIRRVCERTRGERLSDRAAEATAVDIAEPLRGRDRLLALIDVGATVCTARNPECGRCPLFGACATRGELTGETKRPQGRFEGSFRQRRGIVMARLRSERAVPTVELDGEALASLLDDGLAEVTRGRAHLPQIREIP